MEAKQNRKSLDTMVMAFSVSPVFITILFVLSLVSAFSSMDAGGIKDRRWPNARIPFLLDGEFSESQLQNMSLAMNEIQAQSCIQFEPVTRERKFYMKILDFGKHTEFPDACYADHIGVNLSIAEQQMHLGNESCFQVGVIMHELVHVIGLFHEQARCDRDDFVRINLENVQNGAESNFEILEFQPIGPYDYLSLMHYPRKLFATNTTLDTITPLNSRVHETGRLDGLSPCDIYKINRMYSCRNQDLTALKETCEKYVRDSWGGQGHNSHQQFANQSCLNLP